MLTENEKEILKAIFYGYDRNEIIENCDTTFDEIEELKKNNQDFLEELEMREYD